MTAELVIDLVRHMKARNATKWSGPDWDRPLSKLGLRQAEVHAEAMSAGETVLAVYSSPALRCRQTVEPLAARLGMNTVIEPLLADVRLYSLLPIGADNPLLSSFRRNHPAGGRIVTCSHGDTIPALLASLPAGRDFAISGVLKGFGGWFRVRLQDGSTVIERIEAPEGFPHG